MSKNSDSKFGLDYDQLATSVQKAERTMYRLAEVQDRIERVAFDIVRFREDGPEKLWQIQSSDEGDYIVSLYEEEAAKKIATAGNGWSVVVGRTSDLHVFYGGQAVCRLAASDLGVPADEINLVRRYLPGKLASNQGLVNSLLKRCEASVREGLLAQFPELGKNS